MSIMKNCWCGEYIETGRMHYPGGDPENGPAHLPETEHELLVHTADRVTDQIMTLLSGDSSEHAEEIHKIIMGALEA